MRPPSKIHLASKSYLAGWADERGLMVAWDVRRRSRKLKSPAAVAWRPNWWGDDRALSRACEEACGQLETHIPAMRRAVAASWPLASTERGLLAQLVALHVVRTGAFRAWHTKARENSLAAMRPRVAPDAFGQLAEVARSEAEQARQVLALINKVATVIGSMHWTLLTFDEPLLITCDQPVCPVPLLGAAETVPVEAIPRSGWLDTVEVRFPITPTAALVASWHEGTERGPVRGTWEQAANVNRAVRAQADWHWLRDPSRTVPFTPMILRRPPQTLTPIAPQLLAGYGSEAARTSVLRRHAQLQLDRLIEEQDHKTLIMVRAVEAQAA